MEIIKTENLTFTYPGEIRAAVSDISMVVNDGEFITICGKSGCGKSTLLRLLKPVVAPFGVKTGEVFFEGQKLSELSLREQTSKIGFVMQSPDNQIVTDKVWHELAFGLESLGMQNKEIRARVAEMAAFFGIGDLFYKDIYELSGGQKQVLNLASVMVMQPKVLLLDEPTSQLDPIAAQNFIEMLSRINREIGTTVIISEHRLEEAFAVSDRVIVMEDGKIIADNPPKEVGEILKKSENDMSVALPTPMRVHFSVESSELCPLNVREGKTWLEKVTQNIEIKQVKTETEKKLNDKTAISLKDIWFRYAKNFPDVLKGINLDIIKGEFYAVVGGNGTGKTTLLSVISSLETAYRGKVNLEGRVALLPQNPKTLFTEKTVALDLARISKDYSAEAKICGVSELLDRHPYDLSGGEMQRAALAKVLLTKPDVLLMDEPTKGLDAHFKEKFADIVRGLTNKGITVVMVSHDIEFCAKYADRCGMLFDGVIVSDGAPREFFTGKSFYTTAANRMARNIIPSALLAEDIIYALGGNVPEKKKEEKKDGPTTTHPPVKKTKLSIKKIVSGIIFAILFLLLQFFPIGESGNWQNVAITVFQFIFLGISITNLLPQKELYVIPVKKKVGSAKKLKTLGLTAVVLLLVPLTIILGNIYFGERKYFFIGLLIILEIMVPFIFSFENNRPKAREIVLISVLCALAVAGREAFFMLSQFKPIIAIVIISGICFGGETGFLVGAMSVFVSNFFFGQGPWTVWQMFATGVIGFTAAIFFGLGILPKNRGTICLFGGIATLIIYGGIMNPASVLMWQANPTWQLITDSYLAGLAFDITLAASTMFFLWVISIPMIEKIERVKIKYNIMK